jgi:hypothetical protein
MNRFNGQPIALDRGLTSAIVMPVGSEEEPGGAMQFAGQKGELHANRATLLSGLDVHNGVAVRLSGATVGRFTDEGVLRIECGGGGDVTHGKYCHHDPSVTGHTRVSMRGNSGSLGDGPEWPPDQLCRIVEEES